MATRPGTPAAPEAGGGRKDPPLELPQSVRPCRHPNSRLLAPRTRREYISVVLRHPVCGPWLQPPHDSNTVTLKDFHGATHSEHFREGLAGWPRRPEHSRHPCHGAHSIGGGPEDSGSRATAPPPGRGPDVPMGETAVWRLGAQKTPVHREPLGMGGGLSDDVAHWREVPPGQVRWAPHGGSQRNGLGCRTAPPSRRGRKPQPVLFHTILSLLQTSVTPATKPSTQPNTGPGPAYFPPSTRPRCTSGEGAGLAGTKGRPHSKGTICKRFLLLTGQEAAWCRRWAHGQPAKVGLSPCP